MNRILRKQMEELMPVFLGDPPDLPEFDLQGQIDFIDEFMKAGAVEFKLLYVFCVISFKLLTSLMKLKPWGKIALADRQAVAEKLYNVRNPLIRSVPVLCALPLHISYYRREDVATPLGFDAKAWKEEAMLRTVSRERSLPAK
jgi:hypothetical protein